LELLTGTERKYENLDRKIRKILTVYGQHHPRADIDRLYVPTKIGRGMSQIEAGYITETTELAEYIERSEDPLLQVVRAHQHNANSSLLHAVHKYEKNTKDKWEKKRMHGQFPCSLDGMLVDREQTYQWLKVGDIKGEPESLIVAAHDQATAQIIS
jgi:hypothetical protein